MTDIIAQAVSFLERSKEAPLEPRLAFLRKKGLTDEQIAAAVALMNETPQAVIEPAKHLLVLAPGEAPGHINPVLPLIRAFRRAGWDVTVFVDGSCTSDRPGEVHDQSPMGSALRAAGAALRYYRDDGRLNDEPRLTRSWWGRQFQRLPALVDDIRALSPMPSIIVYDVYLAAAPVAARICGVPSVGLITFSGPGVRSASESASSRLHFDPIAEWLMETVKLNLYTFGIPSTSWYNSSTGLNIVTTCEELYSGPSTPQQRAQFASTSFVCVGTLVDTCEDTSCQTYGTCSDFPLERVEAARRDGKRIILLSLGTMLVSHCWHRRLADGGGNENLADNDDETVDEDGLRLKEYDGKRFAQCVWRVATKALGDCEDFLVIVSVGPMSDALDGVELPANFEAFATVPQVRLLPLCSALITHGGMGSLMESIVARVPIIVIPACNDGIYNADAVQRAGFGAGYRYPLRTLTADALRASVHGLTADRGDRPKVINALDAAAQRLESGSKGRAADDARDLVIRAAHRASSGRERIDYLK